MFPAQALAEAMVAKGWRVKLSTDARGARYAGGFPATVPVVVLSSATFARGGVLAKLAVPFRIAGGVVSALWSMPVSYTHLDVYKRQILQFGRGLARAGTGAAGCDEGAGGRGRVTGGFLLACRLVALPFP